MAQKDDFWNGAKWRRRCNLNKHRKAQKGIERCRPETRRKAQNDILTAFYKAAQNDRKSAERAQKGIACRGKIPLGLRDPFLLCPCAVRPDGLRLIGSDGDMSRVVAVEMCETLTRLRLEMCSALKLGA